MTLNIIREKWEGYIFAEMNRKSPVFSIFYGGCKHTNLSTLQNWLQR